MEQVCDVLCSVSVSDWPLGHSDGAATGLWDTAMEQVVRQRLASGTQRWSRYVPRGHSDGADRIALHHRPGQTGSCSNPGPTPSHSMEESSALWMEC
ncbi:unnamed protein product [Gadus morhua 'NCC']